LGFFCVHGKEELDEFLGQKIGLSLNFSKQNLYQAVSVVFTCRRTRLLKITATRVIWKIRMFPISVCGIIYLENSHVIYLTCTT
jgi:hypothetical protein